MKSILLVIFLAAVVTASTYQKPPIAFIEELEGVESRIISGSPAAAGQFPWQVVNKFKLASGGTAFCGGALICDSWVLTAAHCAIDAVSFTLYLGSVNQSQAVEPGRVEVTTTNKTVHESYNPFTLSNDIALIRLQKPVNFTDRIKPIRLGSSYVAPNVTLTVSGWGKTKDSSISVSPILNYVNLRTITNKECEGVYGSLVVKNGTLCCRGAPEHSTCNGDSGGPLVQKLSNGQYEHVGVVSFVHVAGCASGNPSGYVRTGNYLDWIKKHVGNTCKLL